MKNLKKLLALVLVLVMALGMIPFASAASSSVAVKDFTDFDDIEQVEAVDVLTAIGVLNGYPDGSFQPKGTITRAEASKIICYILLGANVANALQPAATGFRDVPAGHWASAFVAYCAQKNIISGYGNGRFGPEDKVTAVQMAKMLLGAVGYGQNGEYDGEGWQLRVVEKANALDIQILSGTGSLDFTTPATREQVARYTFNAMTIPNTVVWNSILNDYSYWSNAVLGTGTKFPTLGEKTFGLVEQERALDPYGYTVRNWRLYGPTNIAKVAGPYRMDVTLNPAANGWTSTNGRTLSQLTTPTSPFFKANLAADAQFFVNGVEYKVEQYSPVIGTTLYRAVAGSMGVDYTHQNVISSGHWTPEEARNAILIELDKITRAGRRGIIVDLVDVPQASEATGYRFLDGRADKVIIIEKTPGAVTAPPRTTTNGSTVIAGLSSELARETHVRPSALANYAVGIDIIPPYTAGGTSSDVAAYTANNDLWAGNPDTPGYDILTAAEKAAHIALQSYTTPNIYTGATNNFTFTGPVEYRDEEGNTIQAADIKAGDYVLYHKRADGVTIVEKAVAVPGQLTGWRNDQDAQNMDPVWRAIAIYGGSEYTASGLRDAGIDLSWRFQTFIQNALNRNRDAIAYLDDNGSIFAFVLGTIPTPNYLILAERAYWIAGSVYGTQYNVAGVDTQGVWVNAIFPDGTTKVIRVTALSSPYFGSGYPEAPATALNWGNYEQAYQAIMNAFYKGYFFSTYDLERELYDWDLVDPFPRMIYSFTGDDDTGYTLTLPREDVLLGLGSQANRSASVSAGEFPSTAIGNLYGLGYNPYDVPLPSTSTPTVPLAPVTTFPDIGPARGAIGDLDYRNQLFRGARFLQNFPVFERELAQELGIPDNMIRGDESTIFVHYASPGAKPSIFVGVSNAPQFAAGQGPDYMELVTYTPWTTSNNMVRVVYLYGGSTTSSAASTVLVFLGLKTRDGDWNSSYTYTTVTGPVFVPGTLDERSQVVKYETYQKILQDYYGGAANVNTMVLEVVIDANGVVQSVVKPLPTVQYGFETEKLRYPNYHFNWSFGSGNTLSLPVVGGPGTTAVLGDDGIYRTAYSYSDNTPVYFIDADGMLIKGGIDGIATMAEARMASFQPQENSMWYVTLTSSGWISAIYFVDRAAGLPEGGSFWAGKYPMPAGVTTWDGLLEDVTGGGTVEPRSVAGLPGSNYSVVYITGEDPPEVAARKAIIQDLRDAGGLGFEYNVASWAGSAYAAAPHNYVIRMIAYKDGVEVTPADAIQFAFDDDYWGVYFSSNRGLLGLSTTTPYTGTEAWKLSSASSITLLATAAGSYAVKFELCRLTEPTAGVYVLTVVDSVWGTPVS